MIVLLDLMTKIVAMLLRMVQAVRRVKMISRDVSSVGIREVLAMQTLMDSIIQILQRIVLRRGGIEGQCMQGKMLIMSFSK